MKGLALAELFFREVGKPAIMREFGGIYERMAFGLVGEGSECLGFDDEISRDHDWGPGFCIWLADEDFAMYGENIAVLYEGLPKVCAGYARTETEQGVGRVGAMSIERFYAKYSGLPRAPKSLVEWFSIPEYALCTATNGSVFEDGLGQFSGIREALLAYYPEDVRIKKLAARCAIMAQAGQYNFPRCIERKDGVAAVQARSEFIAATMSAFHLLKKRYTPFYKWWWRSLSNIEGIRSTAEKLALLARGDVFSSENVSLIEEICAEVVYRLREQQLTDSTDSFLIPHSHSMTKRIMDTRIASLHIMQDG